MSDLTTNPGPSKWEPPLSEKIENTEAAVAPLISCIMPVAAAHVRWIPRAIECFRAQTYEPRELILVRQIPATQAAEGFAGTFPGCSFILSNNESVGAMRNFACQASSGEFIAHWDVDDWYAPERLTKQMEIFRDWGPKLQVCGFCSCDFHDVRNNRVWLFSEAWNTNIGSSLMYRRSWWEQHRFPGKQIGEDAAFINQAASRCVYVSMSGVGLLVARRHKHNTCKYEPQGDAWRRIEYTELPEGYRKVQEAAHA